MASENAAIKKVVTAAKAEERLSLKEKGHKLYVKGLEAKKRAAERTVRELREAPNMTQLLIGAGSSVAGGMEAIRHGGQAATFAAGGAFLGASAAGACPPARDSTSGSGFRDRKSAARSPRRSARCTDGLGGHAPRRRTSGRVPALGMR